MRRSRESNSSVPVVVVNTLAITPENEGTRTMVVQLVAALVRAGELDVVLVCSRVNERLFDGSPARIVTLPGVGRSSVLRIVADQTVVPWIARRDGDVLLTPTSVGPLVPFGPTVCIVTAHLALPSCAAAAGPDGYGMAHRTYYGWPLRRSLRVADAILGISRFLADGVVRELGIEPERVSAMPLGASGALESPSPRDSIPLLLFVGTLYPYKDADVAVRAFARALRAGLPAGTRFAIVGGDTRGEGRRLRDLAHELGVSDAVDVLGRVDDSELERAYASAAALILPSRCEGFGLPAAEAMRRGVPVIAASTTSLPEVVGDGGILVPPGDVEGFAVAIQRLIGDAPFRRSVAERAIERAGSLSWDHAAEAVERAVRDALAGPRGAGRSGRRRGQGTFRAVRYPEVAAGGYSRVDGNVAFYGRVQALMESEAASTVVDFGAGRGQRAADPVPFRRRLQDLRGPGREVIGVDVDPVVRDNPLVDRALVVDSERPAIPLADGSVDLVVSDFTFEHLAEPQESVAELARILRPGGWLCVRTPNRWGYIGLGATVVPNRLHVRALSRLQPSKLAEDTFPTCYRINDRRAFRRYLDGNGFDTIAFAVDHESHLYAGRSRVLERLLALAHRAPEPMRSMWFVFARRRP